MKYSDQGIKKDFLAALAGKCHGNDFSGAREMIKKAGMEEAVFGVLPSDFLFYLPLADNSKVLDARCGLGVHVFNIAKYAGEVWGCDPSKEKIVFCEARKQNERRDNIHFFYGEDARAFFPESTFNAIVVYGNEDDTLKTATSIYPLLKSGGVLCLGFEKYSQKDIKSKISSFRATHTDFFIAYPNCRIPRFIIPSHDEGALKFMFRTISVDRGLSGMLLRFITRVPFSVCILRIFLNNRIVFIRK